MSKQKAASYPSPWQQLFQVGVYKGRQGRITRQVTFATAALIFLIIAYKLYMTLSGAQGVSAPVYYGLPMAVLCGGVWFCFRLVNMTRFADFLIAVEAEMKKVSWPTWPELVRSSMVVVFVIFAMGLVLCGYDFLWTTLLSAIGLFRTGTPDA